MKKEHKYAQVLRWIADGETVEMLDGSNGWCAGSASILLSLISGGNLNNSHDFRLKPRTITVNGREIVDGVKKPPKSKKTCYLPQLYLDDFVSSFTWSGSIANIAAMKKGLVHLDRENAIAHAKAMLNID